MYRTTRRLPAGVAFILFNAGASVEQAQSASASEPASETDDATDSSESAHRLEWDFPRFRLWQIVSSVALSGANLWLERSHPTYETRAWKDGILFDDAVRDGLRADTERGRREADIWSDVFWHPVQYYPVFIDSLLVPLGTDDGNLDVAVQMTLINWQAIALSFFVIRGSHVVIGRARPNLQGCSNDPDAENFCSPRGAAFPSGHTGMAATGAGLSCAHHQALPLYGGGWVEAIPCVVLSAAAAVNGVARIVADKHWATDVIAGYAIGFASGYGIPTLLHYAHKGRSPAEANVLGLFRSDVLPAQTVIMPMMRQDAWGLSIAGWH